MLKVDRGAWRARRAGLLAAVAAAAWLAAPASALQPVRLRLDVTVTPVPGQGVSVACLAMNLGGAPAHALSASLRGSTEERDLGAELGAGLAARATWTLSEAEWRGMRRVAAVRLRYGDDVHHPSSMVAAVAPGAPARVTHPRWPGDPRTVLELDGQAPGGSGEIVWWGPDELGLDGDARYSPETRVLSGVLRPIREIAGTRTSFVALLLPDDGAAAGALVNVPVDASGLRAVWQPDWLLLAAWLAACLCGAVLVARWRPRAPHLIPAACVVAAMGAVLLTAFPPRLLMLDTIPAGGDFASHAVGADWMSRELLPHGRLVGWYPGQYGGFPLFLFYFPLAFVVVALLDVALPLGPALKIGALAGPVLLPFAFHRTVRWMGGTPLSAWCAAAASLWLLLLETQSVWGANLPSLLSGELAYALGFPLAWLAMARAFRERDDPRLRAGVPLLLAAAGLAHGYALVAAALGIGLLVLTSPSRSLSRTLRVACWGGLSFALLGGWIVPLLLNLPWTNGFRERWVLDSAWELLPPLLWAPALLVAIGGARRLAALRARDTSAGPAPPAWLFLFGAAMLGCWALGYSLGVVDVRFLPFAHGALLLAAGWELGSTLEAVSESWRGLAGGAAVLAVAASAVVPVRYIPTWARWNLSGMERAPRWDDYSAILRDVGGTMAEPRVAWEHHPAHDAAGTVRAFELTPLFSGRATLEGLYLQSATLAPAVFHLQSLISSHPSCPLPDFECGSLDVQAALPVMRLLGADSIISYSLELRASLDGLPQLQPIARRGDYAAHRFVDPVALVEPARWEPVVDESREWRRDAHDWLRASRDLDIPLVLVPDDADARWARVARHAPGLPRRSLPDDVEAEATLGTDVIELRTSRPGHPLLLKVAFHPGWRADDGSPVHLVAPGLMLVEPKSERVTLRWSLGAAAWVGLALTLLGLAACAALVRKPLQLPTLPTKRRSRPVNLAWATTGAAACLALAATAAARHPWVDRAGKLASGQVHLAARRFDEAERDFRAVLRGREPHPLRDDAAMHLGLVAAERGDAGEALARWREFLDEWPVTTYRTEVLLRSARLHVALGESATARALIEEAVAAPLAPRQWLDDARRALEELPP